MMNIFGNKENKATDIKDKTLTIRKPRCPQNHACPSVRVCPVGALTQKGFSAPSIDGNKCVKCGKCVKTCPMKALVFE